MDVPSNDSGGIATAMMHENSAIPAKLVLCAALAVGGSYLFGMTMDLHPTALLAWKGGGVWLLAIYAALQARSIDGWLITAVMAMGAAGDVLIETDTTRGALAFAAGHVVAMALYTRNRRSSLTGSQLALALLVVPATMFIAWALPADRSITTLATVYALFLGLMAALAWTSRFPRYRTGIGAMLFVISDLLIFARMGPLADLAGISAAIWAVYFIGQTLIVLGVTATLAADEARVLRPA